MRYKVELGVVCNREWDIWDLKENKCVCSSTEKKDAEWIATILNEAGYLYNK